MNPGLSRFLYLTLKGITRFGYLFYYKRVQREGYEANMRPGVGKVIASNHQNSLSDPMNVVLTVGPEVRPIYLTRADVFRPKLIPLLNFFRMLPIYRTRDNVDIMQANEAIFEQSIQYLLDKDCLGIFPEGSHSSDNHIRPLKKGLARIIFGAAEKSNFTAPIHIVPLGHYYQSAKEFKKGLLLNYGPPVVAGDYYALYQENPQRAIVELTQAIRKALSDVTIDIKKPEYLDFIDKMRQITTPDLNPHKPQDMLEEFKVGKQIVAGISDWIDTASREQIQTKKGYLAEYEQLLKTLKIRNNTVFSGSGTPFRRFLTGMVLALTSPVFAIGLVLNYVPYKLASTWPVNKFKDDHFHSSIRALTGEYYFYFWYAILSGILWAISGSFIVAVTFVLAGIFTAEAAWHWRSEWKKWKGKKRLAKLEKRDSARLMRARQLRADLLSWVKGLI